MLLHTSANHFCSQSRYFTYSFRCPIYHLRSWLLFTPVLRLWSRLKTECKWETLAALGSGSSGSITGESVSISGVDGKSPLHNRVYNTDSEPIRPTKLAGALSSHGEMAGAQETAHPPSKSVSELDTNWSHTSTKNSTTLTGGCTVYP